MHYKDTYFVKVWRTSAPDIVGYGECALFKDLSADDVDDYEQRLTEVCRNPENSLPAYSSIRFGMETALADLNRGGNFNPFDCKWSRGLEQIPINGLVWMGDKETMAKRISEKLSAGFRCLKLKIGGIEFERELDLLRTIRSQFSISDLEIRLDANGAFTKDNAMAKLDALSQFDIHSIEQPIKAGQPELMAQICKSSPIEIALDEELIGCRTSEEKEQLLTQINPRYIILKPALCGGLADADEWIALARKHGIGWWATSALESNIGLNAIAQWLSARGYNMPQGLGTGELYHNNITSPIRLKGSSITYNPELEWQLPTLAWQNV
jgi:L-alanine-DL-glutamate epimerase-like enolase superfamily enzyme